MKAFLDYLCNVGHYSCLDYAYHRDVPRIVRCNKITCIRKNNKYHQYEHFDILTQYPNKVGWRFKWYHPIHKIDSFLGFIPKEIRHLWRFL